MSNSEMMMIIMIIFLILSLFAPSHFANDCDQKRLRDNFVDIANAIAGDSRNANLLLEPFINLALQLGPNQRSEAFAEFCAGKGMPISAQNPADNRQKVANCVAKHILHEHLGQQMVASNGHKHMAHMLQMLLMDKAEMLTELLHNVLTQRWHKYLFVADNAQKLDVWFEFFLTNPREELGHLVDSYKKIYKKDLGHELDRLAHQKLVEKSIVDILKERMDHSREEEAKIQREIGSSIAKLDTLCKHWQTIYDPFGEDDHFEAPDQDVLAMLGLVKTILVNFDTDSEDAGRVGHLWQNHCVFLHEHIFHEERDQKYFETLQRMLIIGNLMGQGSRTVYFQQRFASAVASKDFEEINRLIATRANIDLRQIIEANYGYCSDSEAEGQQAETHTDNSNLIKQFEHSSKSYTKVLKAVLATFSDENCYTENEVEVGQSASPSKAVSQKCPASGGGGGSYIGEIDQTRKVRELLDRHGQMGLEKQAEFMENFGRMSQRAIQSQCKKAAKKEQKMRKKEGEMTEKQRDQWKSIKLGLELCEVQEEINGVEKSKKGDKNKKEEQQKEEEKDIVEQQEEGHQFADIFIGFFGRMSEDPHKLEVLNKLLLQNQSKTVQFIMDKILSWHIFERVRRMPIMVFCTKMIHPEQGPIQGEDIQQLVEWNARLQKTRALHASGGHKRVKREPTTLSITAFLIGFAIFYVCMILLCACIACGDGLAMFLCLFWIFYIIGICLGG